MFGSKKNPNHQPLGYELTYAGLFQTKILLRFKWLGHIHLNWTIGWVCFFLNNLAYFKVLFNFQNVLAVLWIQFDQLLF